MIVESDTGHCFLILSIIFFINQSYPHIRIRYKEIPTGFPEVKITEIYGMKGHFCPKIVCQSSLITNIRKHNCKSPYTFSVPHFGICISQCEICIPHCGFCIPHCGTENMLIRFILYLLVFQGIYSVIPQNLFFHRNRGLAEYLRELPEEEQGAADGGCSIRNGLSQKHAFHAEETGQHQGKRHQQNDLTE